MKSYQLIKEKYIEEIHSNVKLLRHLKSGARILLLDNDDNNKTFTIGFRTPPTDSTGVPHILEHSTLCGSKKFPVKDPFIELLKSSLNTFLNAMTYPDKTIYPVASCNDSDFKNLMEVYMDAVFYPNVYLHEEIFKQEGWHYELENLDSDIIYNGVVYNEMKGAFSSAEQLVFQETLKGLFPDTTYGYVSGGNPDDIPNLTYEQFKDFHRRFYSPANSYIILYGKMDFEAKLKWMDEEYLSHFDVIETDSEIEYQTPFIKPTITNIEYPVGKTDSLENKTYYTYGVTIGNALDSQLALAFNVLNYTILDAPGAPLKQALLDAGLGTDVLSSYDSSMLQPMLLIGVKDAKANQLDEFINVLKTTLTNFVKQGLNKQALKSSINYFEFKYREADFGRIPKGLVFTINALETWLYDESDPFSRLETNQIFQKLKELVNTNYFEELIEKYILNNPHATYLVATPSNTLAESKEQTLKAKLAAYKASLTEEKLQQLVTDTKELKIYQSTPSTSEELETIPLLTKDDIDDYVEPINNEIEELNGAKLIKHQIFTNGICYLKLLFNTNNIPNKLIPYLGLLTEVLGNVDTEDYTYQELTQKINLLTGGIQQSMLVLVNKEDQVLPYFVIDARALDDKIESVFQLITQITATSKLNNYKRLKEIISKLKSDLQMQLMEAGHIAALTRAGSYLRPQMYYKDQVSGIGLYELIETLDQNFEEQKDEIINNLETLMQYIFRKENLIISYTADNDNYKPHISPYLNSLYQTPIVKESFIFAVDKKNEGFKTPSQVQYVARYGNFNQRGKFTGAFDVFSMALKYDYLWTQVRVLGGAYGCMSQTTRSGDIHLVSYRDPNLARTNQVFEDILTYIDNFNPDAKELMKYIIGAIGVLDEPLSPKAKGERSLILYLTNITYEMLKEQKHQVLNVTLEDIKNLKPLFQTVLSQNALCVIGNENKIEAEKDLFKEVKNLFK